jgi:hypothetical protein
MKQLLLILTIAFSITASAQKKDTVAKAEPVYYLIGNMKDFQLLFTSVTKPGDVTPNQVAALAQWLQSLKALPTDTLKNSKPK